MWVSVCARARFLSQQNSRPSRKAPLSRRSVEVPRWRHTTRMTNTICGSDVHVCLLETCTSLFKRLVIVKGSEQPRFQAGPWTHLLAQKQKLWGAGGPFPASSSDGDQAQPGHLELRRSTTASPRQRDAKQAYDQRTADARGRRRPFKTQQATRNRRTRELASRTGSDACSRRHGSTSSFQKVIRVESD